MKVIHLYPISLKYRAIKWSQKCAIWAAQRSTFKLGLQFPSSGVNAVSLPWNHCWEKLHREPKVLLSANNMSLWHLGEKKRKKNVKSILEPLLLYSESAPTFADLAVVLQTCNASRLCVIKSLHCHCWRKFNPTLWDKALSTNPSVNVITGTYIL